MTFAEAKITQAALDAEVTRLSVVLNRFPKGEMGMTPDAVKASGGFQTVKSQYFEAFKQLRAFNGYMLRTFAKECREERRARRVG